MLGEPCGPVQTFEKDVFVCVCVRVLDEQELQPSLFIYIRRFMIQETRAQQVSPFPLTGFPLAADRAGFH